MNAFPSSFAYKLSFVCILMILSVLYWQKRYEIEEYDFQANYVGSAYIDAIDFAFGTSKIFPELGAFSQYIPAEYKQDCHIGRSYPHYNKIYATAIRRKCFLASPHASEIIYKSACSAWRLERCNIILFNPIFREDSMLRSALSAVMRNPCSFYPKNSILDNKMNELTSVPIRTKDGIHNPHRLDWIIVKQYIKNRQTACSPEIKAHKLILKIDSTETE